MSDILLYFLLGVLVAIFAIHEVRIKSRFIAINVFAKLIIIAGLYFLFKFSSAVSSTQDQVIISTDRYSSAQLDSLNRKYPGGKVYDANIQLPRNSRDVFLLGEGLSKQEFDLLDFENLTFLPPNNITGIEDINISSPVLQGEKLKLLVYGNHQDSLDLSFPAEGTDLAHPLEGVSEFEITPQNIGNHIALLNESLQIPYEVRELRRFNILMRTAQPSFKSRFLKDFLVEERHQLVWQTDISRDISYTKDVGNTSFNSAVSPSNLGKLDLLIVDEDFLKNLDSGSRRALKKSIEAGLGLLVMPTTPNYGQVLTDFAGLNFNTKKEIQPGDVEYLLATKNNSLTVVENSDSLRSFQILRGRGKIGGYYALNEYLWKLGGKDSLFTQNFHQLIYRLARAPVNEASIKAPAISFLHEPVELEVFTTETRPKIEIQGSALPLKQDLFWQERWKGTYWPSDTGWHTVSMGKERIGEFFVQKKPHELMAPNSEKISISKEVALAQNNSALDADIGSSFLEWLVIFAMLLCFGFLWIEPKL